MALLVGQYLGDYYLSEHVGQGGYADVYRCVHKNSMTEYALKVSFKPLSSERIQLFLNEVELHSQLKHHSIVKVFDADIKNQYFLVMEYLPLGTLSRLSGQQVELSIIVPYIKQLADALDYIHQQQIVHCDVKPDNFLLAANNTVLLSDFGAAIKTTRPVNSVYGTLEYAAPEQLRHQPCPASDQYSLAITVYEWLTGEAPFNTQHAILTQPAPLLRQKLPTLPQVVEDVILKALLKQPQHRYPTVSAFATALERAYQYTLQPSVPVQPVKPLPIYPTPILNKTRKIGQPIVIPRASPNVTRRVQPIGAGHSLYVYQGHSTDVSAFAWSPDGTRIVSVDINNGMHIWGALDGSNASIRKGGGHMILNVLWSPDNLCIAVADELQTVWFWDVQTGKKLFRYQHRVGKPDEVGVGFYYPMAWSHNGLFMISASDDQPLEKWDTTTGRRMLTYTHHADTIKAIAWSPDERVVASAGADTAVHIWDAISADTQYVYRGHRGPIHALSWAPSSKRIASAGTDGFVHVWDAIDGGKAFVYTAHRPRSIHTIAWSPDGTKIASAGGDGKIRLWNALNGQTLAIFEEHTDGINVVAWSPNGEYLASASNDGTVRVWHSGL
jgi:WD40 repeat protein